MPRKRPPDPEGAGLDEYGLPPIIHTEVLVHLTGVTARRLHQLISDTRISPECNFSGDKWRTTIALREIFGYYRRQSDQKKPPSDKLLESQLAAETLRSAKLKNAKMARELLPRYVYVQVWGELISAFKARWLEFSNKMGPRAFRAKDKVEASEILDREIVDIFSALQDPKFMEDIAAKIRDDEFEHSETGNAPGDSDGSAAAGVAKHLESEDA